MMAINSRRKGKRGEAELARFLREYGYNTRRGQQFCGANGDADVVGLPGIHIEAKRVQNLCIEKAMAQSQRDAREGEIPTVMHRKDYHQWLVTMKLEDFVPIYREWEAGRYLEEREHEQRLHQTVSEAD